jgi:hypothetical protein
MSKHRLVVYDTKKWHYNDQHWISEFFDNGWVVSKMFDDSDHEIILRVSLLVVPKNSMLFSLHEGEHIDIDIH